MSVFLLIYLSIYPSICPFVLLQRVEIKGDGIDPSNTRSLETIKATPLVSHKATPPEDMPQKPTLIDALYNTVGVVKKPKASQQDYISHGKDIRKYRRTVKVGGDITNIT